MIYRSNLTAPDLQPHFAATTICKPRDWSMGHDVMSDKDFEPDCCFMTHDEAAILYNVARNLGVALWCDIGARTGWTTLHIAQAWPVTPVTHLKTSGPPYDANYVYWVEPDYRLVTHFRQNMPIHPFGDGVERLSPGCPIGDTAERFFATEHCPVFGGVMIDGDHDAPQPLNDARGALAVLAPTGVIVFHDFWGQPIRDGVRYLMEQGLKCRVYNTPAGMAVCWRGDFTPPDHEPDPAIDWAQVRVTRAPEFDFNRTV